MVLKVPILPLIAVMRNIRVKPTLYRAAVLGILVIAAPGCQKSDIQACVDAQVEDARNNPKKPDGTWNVFWDNGRFDEKNARTIGFAVCGSMLRGSTSE
jgi:hypothetical protein